MPNIVNAVAPPPFVLLSLAWNPCVLRVDREQASWATSGIYIPWLRVIVWTKLRYSAPALAVDLSRTNLHSLYMDQLSPLDATIHQRGIPFKADSGNASIVLNLWIYFNLVGNNILLPILVITIFISNRLPRHPTFINLCLTWILSGIFSLLLFYTGQYKDSEPPRALCIAQSSLIFGIVPMWSCAVFALFHYVNLSLQGQGEFGIAISWIMLGGPYILQIAFSLAALVISSSHPELVSRQTSFFYCGLHSHALTLARTVFVSLCAGCILIIEVLMLHKLYLNYSSIRHLPVAESGSRSAAPCILRVLSFGLYVAFGTAVDIIAVVDRKSVLPEMYMATTGIAIFLIFGTQGDVLQVWFPCTFKRNRPRRVWNRPYREAIRAQSPQDSRSALQASHNNITPAAQSRTLLPQSASETQSFTLDDLFPTFPPPARTGPVPFLYTHYVV